MKYDKLSRRMFLQGAGKTALAVPFLTSLAPIITTLAPKEVLAATTSMCFINVTSDLCIPIIPTIPGFFNYDTGVYNYYNSVPFIQTFGDGIRYQNLNDIVVKNGKLSHVFDQNWNNYTSKVNIISNTHGYTQSPLHNTTNNSCCSSQDAGQGDFGRAYYNYSVDQIMSESIYSNGAASIPIMLAGLTSGYRSSNEAAAWSPSHNVVGGVKTRYKANNINALYNSLVVTGGTTTQTVVDPKKRIVDLVLEDYKSVSQSRHISSQDKMTLTSIMDTWNDLSKKLQASATTTTATCSYPPLVNSNNATTIHQATMQLIALGFGCGVSNLSAYTLNDLEDMKPTVDEYHGLAHDSRTNVNGYYMQDGSRWRANRILDFIKILEMTPASNGKTVFANTIMLWNHEYANYGHGRAGFIQLFASGATDKFDLGQHIDAAKAPINKLFVTSLAAMGLSPAQYERMGSAGFGEYRPPTGDVTNGVFFWRGSNSFRNANFQFDYVGVDKFMSDAARRTPYHFFKG